MQQVIKCGNCGAGNAGHFKFCSVCGTKLGMPCLQCGEIIPSDSRYCPRCGALSGEGRFGKMQHKVEAIDEPVYCPQCGQASTDGRRFCMGCGARMGINCPTCGTIIELTSGYCSKCGFMIQRKG